MMSNFTMELSIPIGNLNQAEIIYNSLRVDKEPKSNGIKRHMILEKDILKIKWLSGDAKKLRSSVRGFFELLNLSLQTIEQFEINLESLPNNKQLNDNYYENNEDNYENIYDCEDNGDDELRNLPLRSLQVPGTKYEYLDHTADVQIHAWGDDLKEAFEQAADAMFGYMTEINKVDEISQQEIVAEGEDMISLLYHFLDEFLYIFSVEPFFIVKTVKIEEFDEINFRIKAIGFGEPFDLSKHPQGTEVKAITYSSMQIYNEDSRHEVFVIIDI